MRQVMALVLFLALAGVAGAGGLEQGDRETTFRVSYSDTDFGSQGGLDFGSAETTDLSVSWGWMLTPRHEVGFVAGYFDQDIEGGDLGPDDSFDATRIGGFYNFNFKLGGNLTPYVGAAISTLGGDEGDFYDLQYSGEIGVKVYPWEHAGFSFGLSYSELRADQDLPDASALALGAGLLLKY